MNKRAFTVAGVLACLTIHQASAQNEGSSSLEMELEKAQPRTNRILVQSPNHVMAPEAGKFLMETGFGISQTTMSVKENQLLGMTTVTTKDTAKQERQLGFLQAVYGLSRTFYFGARMDYAQTKIDSERTAPTFGVSQTLKVDSQSSGMKNPTLTAGLRLRGSQITTLVEASLKPTMGTAEIASDAKAGNEMDAQTSMTLSAKSFNHRRGNLLLGGGGSYTHKMEGKQTLKSDFFADFKRTVKGGNSVRLEGFAQMPQLLETQFTLSYDRSFATEFQDELTRATTSAAGAEIALVDVSVKVRPMRQLTIIPTIAYGQALNQGFESPNSKLESNSLWLAGVAGRFSF